MVKNLPAVQETWVWSLGWEDSPGERNSYTLQYSGLEDSGLQCPWSHKDLDTTECLSLQVDRIFTLLLFILILTFCPNFTVYNALLEIKSCRCYISGTVCSKNIDMLKNWIVIWNHEGLTLNNPIVQEIYHSVQIEWGQREAMFGLLGKTIGAPEVLKKKQVAQTRNLI